MSDPASSVSSASSLSSASPALAASGSLDVVVRGVSRSFGSQAVLTELDFAPPPGSVVGLLGSNGAGKSTLLKLLLGLLKPDAGEVTIGGHGAWHLPAALKDRIGYVDQQPRLLPWMSAKHLLGYFGSFYSRWDQRLIDRLAGEWDVPMSKPFGKLSPGQQQKVALLAAVAHRPDLLVLDEPMSALDPGARRVFLRSLLDLTAEAGDGGVAPTVLFSTHITSDVERVATHAAILAGGKIRREGELADLKEAIQRLRVRSDNPLPESLGLDLPPGTLHDLRRDPDGRGLTLVSAAEPEALASRLREQAGAEVTVEGLNLEEIYLAVAGGRDS